MQHGLIGSSYFLRYYIGESVSTNDRLIKKFCEGNKSGTYNMAHSYIYMLLLRPVIAFTQSK